MLDDCALHVSCEHDLDRVPTVILADPERNEQRRFIGFGRQDWQETYAAPRSTYRDRAARRRVRGHAAGPDAHLGGLPGCKGGPVRLRRERRTVRTRSEDCA